MAGTQVRMVREITENTDANKRYAITSTCIVPGTLSDTGIFLLALNDPNDPKDDIFVRLVTIEDVNNFLADRNAAVTAGATQWRSMAATIYFADIETANAAWKELSSRINTFVENVDSFNQEFSTPEGGEIITYPTVDEGTKNNLIAAYEASAEPLTTAETERDAKLAECTTLQTSLSTVEDRLVEAQADSDTIAGPKASASVIAVNLPTIQAALSLNNSTIRNLNATSDATDTQKDGIEAQLLSNDAQLTAFSNETTSMNTLNADISGIATTLQTRVNTLTTERNSLQQQLSVCNQEAAQLQAAVSTALEAREAALANVRAVAPDFNP